MRNPYKHKANWLITLLGLFWLAGSASASTVALPGSVVDTDWLAKNLDQVVLLDVRKDVKSFRKRAKSAAPVNPCGPGGGKKGKAPIRGDGHIEGAVLVNLKEIFGKTKLANGKEAKFVLPEKKKFERLMQKSGVDNDSLVVIVSKGESMINLAFATRLYWTLKYFGFDNAAILPGGTARWKQDKHPVQYGKAKKPKKGNFAASAQRKEILATMDEVLALTKGEGNAKLLDVRGKDFYLGLTYTRGKVPPEGRGHVPGAKNFPVALLADSAAPSARLYSKETIEKVARLSGTDLVDTPTVTTCNTGVMASLGWFVLSEVLGNENVRLHDGSMHEWALAGQAVESPLR